MRYKRGMFRVASACQFFPVATPCFFEEAIEQVAVVQLFDAPAIHELPDDRIFAGRRAPQLLVIHVGEVLDVAHVDQHRHKRGINRIVLNLVPANAVNVLF